VKSSDVARVIDFPLALLAVSFFRSGEIKHDATPKSPPPPPSPNVKAPMTEPLTLEDRFRRAVADQRAGRLAEAEAQYRALIAAQPDLLIAHQNLIALLRAAQRLHDLPAAYEALLALAPSDELHFALATNLLSLGRYAEAWPHYEHRPAKAAFRMDGARPEWRGEPLAGKALLIVQEQGLGDQIQMARFIPQLRALGATVTFACTEPLTRLLEPFCPTIARGPGMRGVWDYWIPSMSLPYRLGATLETLPPPLAIASHPSGRGVGVLTRGNPLHPMDAYRSLPDAQAEALLAFPGAVDLDPAALGARDLADVAEVIAGLACIVSVDTAAAHLAASMGKPTFILLPATWTDWRWGLERADSPWYPAARLVRQPAPGDWAGAIEKVRGELAALGA